MAPEVREFNKKKKPQIVFLKGMFGNSAGEIVNVRAEDAAAIYYYDGFRRWCYLLKSEEGDLWKWRELETEKG